MTADPNRLGEHANAVLARAAWEAVSAADVEALEQLLADDLVWHASGRGPRAGDHRGRAAVIEYLAAIGEDADRFDSRLEHILVNDDLVAVLFQVEGERHDRRLEIGFILIFRIADKRIAEVWAIPRDQYAIDEFWS